MSTIKIKKPYRRWLFGGIGFHNSEASMTPIMTEKFKNERVLKCFREISPTFTRVYAGFADWTREAMDHFADYYDQTFRKAGTLIYMVPGRMPMPTADFDVEEHCEKIAANLEYLIKVRKCTKIRYFHISNELSVGNTFEYLAKHTDLFIKLHDALFRAFERHGLDVGLLATDCSEPRNFYQIKWAMENMDEITADYCAHLYLRKYQPGELEAYQYCYDLFNEQVELVKGKQKRFILGEYGIMYRGKTWAGNMINDMSYGAEKPEDGGRYAVALAEMSLSIVNSGTFAGAFWTLFDYPDPFVKEDGDTPEEKARYEVARFSGHGIQIRYNKNGLIKWCDDENDYSARPALYTMGYMAKLFRKGSRVLETTWDDEVIRAGAVTNADGSVSICIVSWGDGEKEIEIELEHKCDKPLRRYDFLADEPYENEFCDLQDYSELVECDGAAKIKLAPRSVAFLTTDYKDRIPSEITNVRVDGDKLLWDPSNDAEHCYYRVFENGKQIASTVANSIEILNTGATYSVISVDKYGNAGELK